MHLTFAALLVHSGPVLEPRPGTHLLVAAEVGRGAHARCRCWLPAGLYGTEGGRTVHLGLVCEECGSVERDGDVLRPGRGGVLWVSPA